MRNFTLALLMVAIAVGRASAQDTFSIVAVDPSTGEVGSAGASCIDLDVAVISDIHVGVGAINTQALYNRSNQEHARQLMRLGVAPRAIIDSLIRYDSEGAPEVRQYGIAALVDGGTTAAHTGTECIPYKGHLTGGTWSIQGNILLGAHILDSMAARFERAQGSLAERLMYALMGARVRGADTRCDDLGTSSLGAYIRVARPGDHADTLMLDIRVIEPLGIREPLDTLQSLFNRWKLAGYRAEDAGTISDLDVVPNPATGESMIVYDLQRAATVRFSLYDNAGREISSLELGRVAAGPHEIALSRLGTRTSGSMFLRLTAGTAVRTRVVR